MRYPKTFFLNFVPQSLLLLAFTLLAGWSGAEESPVDLLKKSEQIVREEERQLQVNLRMDTLVGNFLALVSDLRSNGLFADTGGDELERLAQVLRGLSAEHVVAAAKHLNEARQHLSRLQPHLDGADTEIEIILKELEKLLRRAQSFQSQGILLNELHELVRNQEKLLEESRKVGKRIFEGDDKAAPSARELSKSQAQVAQNVDRLLKALDERKEAEADPLQRLNLSRAADILNRQEVPKLLEKAAQNMEKKQFFSAVPQQQKALEALREAEHRLQPEGHAGDLQEMQQARETLAEIKEKQTGLRERTEGLPEQQFTEKQKDLHLEQHELGRQLDELDRALEQADARPEDGGGPRETDAEANAPADNNPSSLETAKEAMAQAENGLEAGRQDLAAPQQKKAEQALQQALESLDQQIAAAQEKSYEDLSPADRLQGIENQQQSIREETGRRQALQQDTRDLSEPQSSLHDSVEQFSREQQPGSPMQEALREAQEAMARAADSLSKNEPQVAGEHQAHAAEALREARQQAEEGDQRLAQQAPASPHDSAEASQQPQQDRQDGEDRESPSPSSTAEPHEGHPAQSTPEPSNPQVASASPQPHEAGGQESETQTPSSQKRSDEPGTQTPQEHGDPQDAQAASSPSKQSSPESDASSPQDPTRPGEHHPPASGHSDSHEGGAPPPQELGKPGGERQAQAHAVSGQHDPHKEDGQASQGEEGQPGETQPENADSPSTQRPSQAGSRPPAGQASQADPQASQSPQTGQDPRDTTQTPQGHASSSAQTGGREFNKTAPAESREGLQKKSTWRHLGPRDRDMLNLNFEREFPLEYRELLRDYYEALSHAEK